PGNRDSPPRDPRYRSLISSGGHVEAAGVDRWRAEYHLVHHGGVATTWIRCAVSYRSPRFPSRDAGSHLPQPRLPNAREKPLVPGVDRGTQNVAQQNTDCALRTYAGLAAGGSGALGPGAGAAEPPPIIDIMTGRIWLSASFLPDLSSWMAFVSSVSSC